jgi:hypothetical protein
MSLSGTAGPRKRTAKEGEHDVHRSGASERIRRFPTRRLDRNLLGSGRRASCTEQNTDCL